MESRAHRAVCEVREGPNGQMITGYAAVFNRDSENLGGFIEQVDPGAFDKTLREADVRALLNHDSNWMLGRSKSGSLRLSTDSVGLRYEIDIDPNDVMAASTLAKVRRGDLDGSSFSFRTISDAWDWQSSPARRRLTEVALIDVGPVVYPAYHDSTAAARALDKVARKVGHPVEELVMALQSGEIRSLVEPPAPPDDDTPEPEPAAEESRVGKKFSAYSREQLTAAARIINDLLSEGPDAEDEPANDPEGDDDPDDTNPQQNIPARSWAAVDAELRMRERHVAELMAD